MQDIAELKSTLLKIVDCKFNSIYISKYVIPKIQEIEQNEHKDSKEKLNEIKTYLLTKDTVLNNESFLEVIERWRTHTENMKIQPYPSQTSKVSSDDNLIEHLKKLIEFLNSPSKNSTYVQKSMN